MYVPSHYRNESLTGALDWLRRYPFAALVTAGFQGMPMATSVPFIVETDDAGNATVVSHLARRNPHSQILVDGMDALVVLNGPSAYISPRWYESSVNVPTWDYVGAQFSGTLKVVRERDALLDLMRRTISTFERSIGSDWTLEEAPEELVERLIHGVIGFELSVTRFDCIQKLSQNKPTDLEAIKSALRKLGPGYPSQVADLMDDVGP